MTDAQRKPVMQMPQPTVQPQPLPAPKQTQKVEQKEQKPPEPPKEEKREEPVGRWISEKPIEEKPKPKEGQSEKVQPPI